MLEGVELEEVQRVTPTLLIVKVPESFSTKEAGALSLVVIGPDGQQSVLMAAVRFSEQRVHLAVVLRFTRLDVGDLPRFEPVPLRELTPDRYGMRLLTILRQDRPRNAWSRNGSVSVYGLLPARMSGQGGLFYNGRKVVRGATVMVRVAGKEYEGEVVSTPVAMMSWAVLEAS